METAHVTLSNLQPVNQLFLIDWMFAVSCPATTISCIFIISYIFMTRTYLTHIEEKKKNYPEIPLTFLVW